MGDEESLDCFNLGQYGYIILLEKGDKVLDLGSVGLGRSHQGLLGCGPEFMERYDLADTAFYRICVMYNNEYMMTFFSIVGVHDDVFEEWLKAFCEN